MNLRIRYGLFWRGTRPTLADYPQGRTYTIRLLIILALWGWAMDQDYIAEQASEAMAAELRAEHAERTLADCLNGRASWITADKREMIACEKAWSAKL